MRERCYNVNSYGVTVSGAYILHTYHAQAGVDSLVEQGADHPAPVSPQMSERRGCIRCSCAYDDNDDLV
eukprot:2906327-Pyramimonas_sp.AAC.1